MTNVVEKWMEQRKREGIEQGIEQGSAATAREDLLEVLRARFGRVPQPVADWVAQEKDVQRLRGCLKAAATVESMEEFREAPPGS